MQIINTFLTIVYVFSCLFLGFVVLIQKGEGGGLGGLAGGAAVDQAFGARADMTWKRATAVAATLFMTLAILLGVLSTQLQRHSIAEEAHRKEVEKKALEKAGTKGKLGPEITSPGAKTDAAETEPAKTEPAKTEPAKTEPAKTEPAKTEPAKTE
ncbi:MAG: preprotein translocase subunit SecG [Planctomycetota bacterium]